MKLHKLVAALAVAAIASATITPPLEAQTPKPPTDARRTVQPAKRGKLSFDAQDVAFEIAATKAKDIYVSLSLVNPALPEFLVGLDFRAVTYSRYYMLLIASNGQTGMFISRDVNDATLLKEPVYIPTWRKNAGEANDVALYVRANQAMLFVNRAYVDTWDVGEIYDFGHLRLFATSYEAGEIAYRNFTVKVPNNAVPPAEPSLTKGPVADVTLSLYRSGYAQWGQPAGMADPRRGCEAFDDGHPVWQFQAVMQVTNNTKYPMKRWAPFAIKNNGQPAFGCLQGYGYMPEIPPGGSVDITVDFYVEKNESVAYLIVLDLDLGRSNRLPVPAP